MPESKEKRLATGKGYVATLSVVHNIFKNAMENVAKIDVATLEDKKVATFKIYIKAFLQFLHNHHEGEDTIVFPVMRAKDAEIAALLDELEKEHSKLMTSLAQLEEITAKEEFTKEHITQIKAIFAEFQPWLTKHLDTEIERMNAEWLAERFTSPELNAITSKAAKHGQHGDSSLIVPFFTYGVNDADRSTMLPHIPWFVRYFIFPGILRKREQVWRDWSPNVKTDAQGRLIVGAI